MEIGVGGGGEFLPGSDAQVLGESARLPLARLQAQREGY